MTTTLFTGGLVRPLKGAMSADWALVDGESFTGFGSNEDAPRADRTIDMDGGTLVPAFCDAHVHLPATGLYATGLDFRGETSARAITRAFKERAAAGEGILFGGNFEDPLDEPLTRATLDAAVGERPALLGRADMHSCIVSTALLKGLDVRGLEGVDVDTEGRPTGYLREQAAAEAWRWFDENLPTVQQRDAIRAAIGLAYSKGVVEVHEMYVVEWRGWDSFEVMLEATRDTLLDVIPYLATSDVERVVGMGMAQIGGDYFLDGAFGSHTAWMQEPYDTAPPEGSPPCGIKYRSNHEVLDFFAEAQAAGLQVGVHAIGDAAIEQAIACWEKVAAKAGLAEVRRLGHRIEHLECSTDDHMARAAHLGLKASVQPAFDHYWGGTSGLYARRIGADRALGMNRFGSMVRAGLEVGAGSDSTVTPLDPFLQMASLRAHHVETESLDGLAALWAHTAGSFNLAPAGGRRRGLIDRGVQADLAWLDRDPVTCSPEDLEETSVRGTWIKGARVWPEADAESE